jgi:aminoglycoside/choline kinase family phosphotransferase/CTP:molybdopterin cytidylyltransferase MocA
MELFYNILQNYPNLKGISTISDGASQKKINRISPNLLSKCNSSDDGYDSNNNNSDNQTKSLIIIDFSNYTLTNLNNVVTNKVGRTGEQVLDNKTLTDSQLDIFIDANTFLKKHMYGVPKLHCVNKDKQIIICQDLGDSRLYDVHKDYPQKSLQLYLNSVKWIIDLQNVNIDNVSPLILKKNYGLNAIRYELNDFVHNVLSKCGKVDIININILNNQLDKLTEEIYLQPKTVVHRDFQSKNILVSSTNLIKNINIIDFQDMCIGPMLHDLVSLLYDLNVCLEDSVISELMDLFYSYTKSTWTENSMTHEDYKQLVYKCALHRVMKSMTWRGKRYFGENDYKLINELKKGVYMINYIKEKIGGHNQLFYFLDKYLPSSVITVILGAGKGSRMNVMMPKVLCPILGRPMIEYVIDQAIDIRSDHIFIIVGYKKDMVIKTISQNYKNIQFIVQKQQLGTGHAVMQAINLLRLYSGDVLVLLGDAPLISSDALIEFIQHHKFNNLASSIMTKQHNDHGCGKVIRDNDGNFIGTVDT